MAGAAGAAADALTEALRVKGGELHAKHCHNLKIGNFWMSNGLAISEHQLQTALC
jgi:hypothetical protein